MANKLEEMPLFPLNTVLFPFASVQLHVFEERYREMVRNCLDMDLPFGVVLIRQGDEVGGVHADPYMVGTAARILRVRTYDDGRMDIHVKGERRFRIRSLDESKPYLVGMVEPVVEHDMEESEEAVELLARARAEFEVYIQRLFSSPDFAVQVVFPPDPVALSFTIANLLQIENLEKQKLLETTDTLERVQDLLPILEQQMIDDPHPQLHKLSSQELSEWMFPN